MIRDVVEEFGGTCPMEAVSPRVPELTDAQVFLAIDEMSRSGELCLMRDAQGTYFVRLNCVATPRTHAMSSVQ